MKAFGAVVGKVGCLQLRLMLRRATGAQHLSAQNKGDGKKVSAAASLCLICSQPGSLSLEISFKIYVLL